MEYNRQYVCPDCGESSTAQEWVDAAKEYAKELELPNAYPADLDKYNFSEVRVGYYWSCPECDNEVDGEDIEEVIPE